MKKIPTLFERVFENHKIVDILPNITPGCEEAFLHGDATVKFDGACCAIIDGKFYKRYDAKKGKTPPEGAIPCCDPDPITGHWPHWVPVSSVDTADQWFIRARRNCDWFGVQLPDGTYEAVGPHFQGNPHGYVYDALLKHGSVVIEDLDRSFEAIKGYLTACNTEGIVFWLNGEPVCKIKRSDFGLPWGRSKK